MTRNLDEDEKGMQIVHTPSGDQEMIVINESGMYAAVLKSRKPEAKPFRKWVTSKVLPTIRKTGSYTVKISKAQAGELACLIAERFPDGKSRPYAWSRFNNHFQLYACYPLIRRQEQAGHLPWKPSATSSGMMSWSSIPRSCSIERILRRAWHSIFLHSATVTFRPS